MHLGRVLLLFALLGMLAGRLSEVSSQNLLNMFRTSILPLMAALNSHKDATIGAMLLQYTSL